MRRCLTSTLLCLAILALLLAGCVSPPPVTTAPAAPAAQVAPAPVAAPTGAAPASGNAWSKAATPAGGATHLKVSASPFLSYGPFYIAQKEGYFAEQGLDVEIVQVARSSDVIPSLAQGKLDAAGFNVSSALLNAIARDSGLKIVASKERQSEGNCVYSGFVIRAGLPLTLTRPSAEALAALRYDVTPTSVSGYELDRLLQSYGLSLDKVKLVSMPNSATTLQGLQSGSVDVSALTEPWITRVRSSKAGDVWTSRNSVDPNVQLAVVAYGPTLLKQDPGAGERFMTAYLKGVRKFNEGKNEGTMTLLEEKLQLDKGLLDQMCWPTIPADGAINAESIAAFGEWATARNLIDKPVPASLFWEPRFVDYANRVLGSN